MVRRAGRGVVNTADIMVRLRDARECAIAVRGSARIGSPEYEAAGRMMDVIDDMAGVLTGRRDALWAPHHTAGS